MCRACCFPLLLLLAATGARAQDTSESWKVGVSGAAGWPSSLGSIRVGAPLGPKAGVDFAVARLNGFGSMDTGPAFISQVRWMRGGRKASGNSRYWIFGILGMETTSSTLIIYPGNVRKEILEESTMVMPRFGYGWDHVTRRGTRIGVELTTGSPGENVALMLANVFVMWGPPRR